MRMLIYAGPSSSREQLLGYAAPLVERVASEVTLVSGGGEAQRAAVEDAAELLAAPPEVAVHQRCLPGDPHQAIMAAAEERAFDLVVLGRMPRPLASLVPGARARQLPQALQPSVLRVQGQSGPIRRIMLASGGDFHTYEDVSVAARIAGPLGAAITLVHIVPAGGLVVEGFGARRLSVGDWLAGSSPEAGTLRSAAAMLRQRGIKADVRGRSGPVLDELTAELRRGAYDLLVVGAHRIESPLSRILLEDIAGELLDVSPLPVLVVKGHQP